MSQELAGKVAVISGGTTGIGVATAQRFAAEGAHVFIFGRRKAQLDEATKLIAHDVTAIQADAANLNDLDRVAATVKAEKGVVDIIVSNAGYTEQASIDTITPEHFDKAFNLMARGPVFLVQKLLPMMTSAGSIILISSAMHLMGIPGHTATLRLRRRCVLMPEHGLQNSRIAAFASTCLAPVSLTRRFSTLNRRLARIW